MRHRIERLAVLATLLFVGPPTPAIAAPSPVAALLDGIGVEDHVEEWTELTSAARDRAWRDLPREDLARLERLLDEAYAPASLRRAVELVLADETPADRLVALERAVAAPPFARHRRLLERQQGRDGLASQPVRMARVLREKVAGERVALLWRLDHATGRSENALSVAAAHASAIARGHQALLCRGAEASAAEQHARRDEIESARRHAVSTLLHTLNLAYWDSSNQEIEEFVEVVEDEAVRWFHARLGAQLKAALERAEEVFAARLDEDVEARCRTKRLP